VNWHTWIEQHMPATEIQRGGAAVWPKDGHGLIGDALGPVMHLHDDASEIVYFVGGRCRLEIGSSQEILGAGDFVLVPSGVPHNLWNEGNDDLFVFWIVAPNFVHNKWRTENFPPSAVERRALRSRVAPGADLPGDENIRTRLLTLLPHVVHSARTGKRQEAIMYLVEGQADVRVGLLGGRLAQHDFVHVPVDTAYSVGSIGGSTSVFLFEMPAV